MKKDKQKIEELIKIMKRVLKRFQRNLKTEKVDYICNIFKYEAGYDNMNVSYTLRKYPLFHNWIMEVGESLIQEHKKKYGDIIPSHYYWGKSWLIQPSLNYYSKAADKKEIKFRIKKIKEFINYMENLL